MGFDWLKRQPIAVVVSAADIDARLVFEDLAAAIPTGNKRAKELLLKKAELRAQQEAWKPFEMIRAPLFRTRLLRLGHDDHVFLLILHHIIVDGWSIGILFEEVSEIYSALASGRQAGLPEPALQFSDFANWQRRWCAGELASRQIVRWRDHLRGAVPVFSQNVGAAGPRPGSGTAHEPVHLPADLVARLSALSRSQDSTLFMTLLAGFKAMLLARNGRGDMCVATIMANRSELWTEHVIGPFENTTLIRTRLDPDLSFGKRSLACAIPSWKLTQGRVSPSRFSLPGWRKKTVSIQLRSRKCFSSSKTPFAGPWSCAIWPFDRSETRMMGNPSSRSIALG